MSVINTNSLSLIAQGNLAKSQSALGTAIERLSSGLRINSAKDDAAGQAIANRFTANIKGLTQAARNANDGISIAQTTEGALNEINNNLQRIRELSVQAANGTNEASDLNSIQDEINQRLGEINRVSAQTQFNGVNVLGKDAGKLSIQVGANDHESIAIGLRTIDAQSLGLSTFNVTGPIKLADGNATANAAESDFQKAFGITTKVAASTISMGAAAAAPAAGTAAAAGTAGAQAVPGVAGGQAAAGVPGAGEAGTAGTAAATGGGSPAAALAARLGVAANNVALTTQAQVDGAGNWFARIAITTSDAQEITNLANNGIKVEAGVAKELFLALDPTKADLSTEGQANFNLDVAKINLTDLREGRTTDALQTLDLALSKVDQLRGELGAVQNRFESTIANLNNTITNLSAARSRIEDADYAVEVSQMTRAQILQQAGTSVLAQANQVPQTVLSLLR
jgi:flagellin